ncbi:MAG: winged helix-turn-helix domain-containing protein, partial [Candidatus Moranbacteria bacterium]|nr:winged helix-turn-helix domain-containing protein [Candidatus Moranbacteria bacterium]
MKTHSDILKNVRMSWYNNIKVGACVRIKNMLAIKRKNKTQQKTVKVKSSKQIERHIKGVANHRRIDILFLIGDHKGITVDMISGKLKCNMKTISSHILRLENAGLIRKRNSGRFVSHELSPYGKTIHTFLTTFS